MPWPGRAGGLRFSERSELDAGCEVKTTDFPVWNIMDSVIYCAHMCYKKIERERRGAPIIRSLWLTLDALI